MYNIYIIYIYIIIHYIYIIIRTYIKILNAILPPRSYPSFRKECCLQWTGSTSPWEVSGWEAVRAFHSSTAHRADPKPWSFHRNQRVPDGLNETNFKRRTATVRRLEESRRFGRHSFDASRNWMKLVDTQQNQKTWQASDVWSKNQINWAVRKCVHPHIMVFTFSPSWI